MRKWGMVILRSSILETDRLKWERLYHDKLIEKGFKLLNCVKPHAVSGNTELIESFPETNEASVTVDATIDDTIKHSLSDANGPFHMLDDLLRELKKEILHSREATCSSEIVAKNRNLIKDNADLTRKAKDHQAELAKLQANMDTRVAQLEREVAVMREFNDYIKTVNTGGVVAPVAPANPSVTRTIHVAPVHMAPVHVKDECVQKRQINEYKKTKVECTYCGKMISKNNISAHRKKFHSENNKPTYVQLVEQLRIVNELNHSVE